MEETETVIPCRSAIDFAKETINYLRRQGVRHILPSHCTELPALAAFHEAFVIKQIRSGDVLNF